MGAEEGRESRPAWDQDLAEALVGKRVVIGLTRLRRDGTAALEQRHGIVTQVHSRRGVCFRLEGSKDGEIYWLPPDIRNYQQAAPGEYRLRETGEIVVDPDFTTTWTVYPPANEPVAGGADEDCQDDKAT